jgi:Mg2+-importing ATPase
MEQQVQQASSDIALPNLIPGKAGLTSDEAHRRLDEYGSNEPARAKRTTAIVQILIFLVNPLVIILLIASVISAFLGELINSTIIAAMVLVSVALNFVQTYRSQRAADRLRAQVALTATALRDGAWAEVRRREIVPGDIIHLSAGDLVPADARLIQAKDLHMNEAALTGESLPVEKQVGKLGTPPEAADKSAGLLYLGTSVVSGTGIAEVTATGPSTQFGEIVARLAARAPETEFERGTRRFGLLIMRTVFFLVLFVIVINVVLRRDAFESLLFAVSLAVGLTPEFLPMITTVTLGKGAVYMARQKVIVKHLAAIQNFGSMDILCSDKTGTLTSGNTVLCDYVDPLGKRAEPILKLAYLNSYYQTGIRNPLDQAVLQLDQVAVQGSSKIDEIPFDFERRRMSVVINTGDETLLITKGAPESVLVACTSYEVDGSAAELSGEAAAACKGTYERLSQEGYRILAIAYSRVPLQKAYGTEDEASLTLSGFLAFLDPPREDAARTLESLRDEGVEVKILTGDNELVAGHICREVGIDAGRIVLGPEVDKMNDESLGHLAENTAMFARVSPSQKNRIILALKRRGHVVGFLGDGINDAPSLHTADVGISVASAVDVAKDAAEIILLERSLSVLQNGVIEGRKAFGNVMKYLLMGTSSNFGNMFSMAGAALFLPFLPMLPTQILLNNFLYDLSQVTIPTDNVDDTYVRKPRRWSISLIRDFMIYIGPVSSIYDFLTFFIMLRVFHATEALFHTGWFVESLATQTLVLFVIRTIGNPLRSRPSGPLAVTTLAVVLTGVLLPFSALARPLGFTPLPALYFLFLAAMTITYLMLVEVVKRWLMKREIF